MFHQITILGPGLLGASLALAVKERHLAARILAWSRRAETRARCAEQAWCDAVFDTPEDAVVGSDLVLVCTPVETIVPLIEKIRPHLMEAALLTDVGSTKHSICESLDAALSGGSFAFVGSHPMAGSERAGMEHARSDLFEGAPCILTPTAHTGAATLARIRVFWEALGMRVTTVPPQVHDRIVAHISHLPHLLASSLCSYLGGQEPDWASLSGSGLRDTTRVAAGEPSLWQQIVSQNKTEILAALSGFEGELKSLKATIERGDAPALRQFLERGKNYRDALPRL